MQIFAIHDLFPEFLGKQPLFSDRLEHRIFASKKFSSFGGRVFDGSQRDFVQSASRFLSIASDERNRIPGVEQFDGCLDLSRINGQLLGDFACYLGQVQLLRGFLLHPCIFPLGVSRFESAKVYTFLSQASSTMKLLRPSVELFLPTIRFIIKRIRY